MAGIIIGAQGYQRSGKTLLMYMITKKLSDLYNLPVYSNIMSPKDNFNYINSLDELPFNFEPKILFIDEIYNGADAQDWKKLKEISILINTLGKQNVLFLFTTISFDMIYNRIRNQMQVAINVKATQKFISYQWINMNKQSIDEFSILKSQKLFNSLNYDTNFVPFDFDFTMGTFKLKLYEHYKKQYPQINAKQLLNI